MHWTGELQQPSQMAPPQMGFYCDASKRAIQVSFHTEKHGEWSSILNVQSCPSLIAMLTYLQVYLLSIVRLLLIFFSTRLAFIHQVR